MCSQRGARQMIRITHGAVGPSPREVEDMLRAGWDVKPGVLIGGPTVATPGSNAERCDVMAGRIDQELAGKTVTEEEAAELRLLLDAKQREVRDELPGQQRMFD